MSTAKIFRKGISTLLNSAIVEILAGATGTEKPVELLKENLTFTANEMAQAFQTSYSYACCAVSSGLASPENQQSFWQALFQANVNRELAARIEQDYVQPFAQQHGLSAAELTAFQKTAARQCQTLAKLTIFSADNLPFSEAELARFVTTTGASSLTELVLELVQTQQTLDERVVDFLQFEELLGNALLFFLHEQLRKDKRFNDTLAALQREGLLVEVREIKQVVLATEAKLNQAVAAKTFGDVAQLGQQLERLQQVESVAQTHYAGFLDFSQRFADWAQLINVQLEQVLAALPKLQEQLGDIKGDTEQILAIVQQLMEGTHLSAQIKPRDELTQHSADNLALITQARQLLKRIPSSAPQYSQMAIELGSIVASQGNVTQAEALLIKAYQQARNDEQRALAAFNLFQVFIRQQVYDKAFSSLQEAIKLNPQQYALHNVHTYRLQRILGAGGMGCAFLAQHRLKKELVVIKSFWETLPGSADALFHEAFLMAEIAGDYVPQPLDCGFVDLTKQARGYFISEYIEGTIDGETWLAKYGKLDVQTGIAVGLQIAKGLQLAHHKGIFHFDLKPANILLQRRKMAEVSKTSEVSVKIIDFGLAKVAPSLGQEMAAQRNSGLSLFAQAAVFGTMNFAPPEQQGLTSCGEPSAKSDVYALGKTLYRLLTGESPQTLDPRCLADAPELFYVLCDCVKVEPDRRLDVATVIEKLTELLRPISEAQPTQSEPIQPPASPQPVEKAIQPEPPRIVQIDKNRQWWKQLDDEWKMVFKEAIEIEAEPTDSDLEKIVHLQELSCRNNQLSDLEPLRALTKLQILDCNENQLSDLEPLRALTKLQILDCNENQLSDLEPLRALTKLQILDCNDNQLSDLEPLRALTNLQDLSCNLNQLSDLEPLRALTKLQTLVCQVNKIHDLEPLRALTKLQILDCNENQLSDLEPLRALTKLQILDCSENQLSNLEPLCSLTNLQDLNCWHNQISNLKPLRALTNLQILDCNENQLSDLEPLCSLTNLQNLSCNLNQLSDLEPLRALTKLQTLMCQVNQIHDLEPLRALTKLRELHCDGNQISDLEPLCTLTKLQTLACPYNQIHDLEPLRALTKLRELYCNGNQISWWNMRKFKKAVPNCTV